jgi:hypothetical protein
MIILQKVSFVGSSPPLRGLAKWAAWASIVAVPIALLTCLPPASHVATPDDIVAPRATDCMVITQVIPAAPGDEAVELYGRTPFPGKKHYIVVQPPAGAPVIQDEPMRSSPDGEVWGRAVLGSKSAGAGQEFTIQVFVTATTLHPGSQSIPSNAKFSDPLTFKRRPKGA